MKILLITPTLPYPLDTGGRIVVFNTIKQLAKRHQIFLISLIQPGQQEYTKALESYCFGIETVLKDINFTTPGLLLNLFSSIPYSMIRYHSTEMEQKIVNTLSRYKFDLVQLEHLHMAQYAKLIKGIPVVLREHNVESKMMQRYYKYASNIPEKIYAHFQWLKVIHHERKLCLKSDLVIVLSRVDQKFLIRLSPQISTAVVSGGVDFNYFVPSPQQRDVNKIIYIGGLSFPPVYENILNFLKRTWPLIKRNNPQVKLYIVGDCPEGKRERIERYVDVILLGHVKDVRDQMATAILTVVPHRIASGIRLKILEAMAMKLPIVSTSTGCEGLSLVDGKHLFVSDSPQEFSDKVTILINHNGMRRKITEEAYNFVRENYSWELMGENLNNIYHNLRSSIRI